MSDISIKGRSKLLKGGRVGLNKGSEWHYGEKDGTRIKFKRLGSSNLQTVLEKLEKKQKEKKRDRQSIKRTKGGKV